MLNLSPAAYELIGYAAAVLTTFSFAPQAWHTYRAATHQGIVERHGFAFQPK
jgi:uncharacterized protein with PQ loop repeat